MSWYCSSVLYKKDDSEKNIKTSISIRPETYALLLKYSKKDERSVSWIADKAIRTWLEKREEEGE